MLLQTMEVKLTDVLTLPSEERQLKCTAYLDSNDANVFSDATAAAMGGSFHMMAAFIFSMIGLGVPKLTPTHVKGKLQFVAVQYDKDCMPTWSAGGVDVSFTKYAKRALFLVKTLRLRRKLTLTGTVKPKNRKRAVPEPKRNGAGASEKAEAETCVTPTTGGKPAAPGKTAEHASTKVGVKSVTPTSGTTVQRRGMTTKATLEDLLAEMKVDAAHAYRASYVALDAKAMKELQSVQKANKDRARATKLNVLEAGNVDLAKRVADAIKGGLDLRISPKVKCTECTVVA